MKNAWLPEEIFCPDCGADIKLTEKERAEKQFACPACKESFLVKDSLIEDETRCPNCEDVIPVDENACTLCGWSEEISLLDSASLVTVCVPQNEAEHLAIAALLQSAGIEYYSKNSGVQSLFGVGVVGTGFNLATGPIQIQVPATDADDAIEIIQQELPEQDDDAENSLQDLHDSSVA